jgi:hypothetical protein
MPTVGARRRPHAKPSEPGKRTGQGRSRPKGGRASARALTGSIPGSFNASKRRLLSGVGAADNPGAVHLKNPSRFLNRGDPPTARLGAPSAWMKEGQIAAWEAFQREIPWLAESDRTLLEIAVTIRARLIAGEEVGVQALNLLRQALGQMGGTPADRTRIETPEEISDDPTDRFFDS